MFKNVCILVLFAIFGSAMSWLKDPNVPKDVACLEEAQIQDREPFDLDDIQIKLEYDRGIACYWLCTGKKGGFVNDNGTLTINGFKAIIFHPDEQTETKANEISRECSETSVYDDPCKTFHENLNCGVDKTLISAFGEMGLKVNESNIREFRQLMEEQ